MHCNNTPARTSGGICLPHGGETKSEDWVWDPVEWSKCETCKMFHSNRMIPDEYWNRNWKIEPKKNTAGVILIKTVVINGANVDMFWMVQSYHNSYGFPKGKMEKGETSKQAAEREFYEETGTVINLDKCMEMRQTITSMRKNTKKIISFFVKRVPVDFDITTFPKSDHEITSFGWVSDTKNIRLNKVSQDMIDKLNNYCK